MLADKLASLHFAEQLLRVAAHIARVDFVSDNLKIRIHNEGAALRETGLRNQDFKVARERLGRVREHGIGNLRNLLGVIVPRLVDKVRVAGDRIDLTACLLEGSVVVLEVLELGRAHKGEVRRVEEEDAPLAAEILAVHGLKAVVLKRLCAEIADFLADKGHVVFLLVSTVNVN